MIEANPIDVHFNGKLTRIDFPDPASAELHVDEQIKRFVKGPLPGRHFGGNARISEGFFPVDAENELRRVPLYAVNIVVVSFYFPRGAFGRVAAFGRVRVAGVNGFVGEVVEIEMLHDVDFSGVRPTAFFRKHPERGPCSLCAVELGADFDFSVAKRNFSLSGNSAGNKGRRILFRVAIYFSAKNQFSVFYGKQRGILGHCVFPVRCAAFDFGPIAGIDFIAVKFVGPNQFPFRCGVCGERNRR